jgi:uncharacterized membrane-anchored protein YhcB (DUF1043 family)
MKIKDLLDVQEVLEKRKTPCDMHNEELNQHFSRSKNEYMDILDMDLIHLVRSYSKCLNCDGDIVKEKSQEILNNLDVIENRLSNVKELFRNSN